MANLVCHWRISQLGLRDLVLLSQLLVHVVNLFPERPRGLHPLDLETIELLVP